MVYVGLDVNYRVSTFCILNAWSPKVKHETVRQILAEAHGADRRVQHRLRAALLGGTWRWRSGRCAQETQP